MKLSVCIDAVFMGKDIEQAIGMVKKAEIQAVEFWTWEDKDIHKLKKAAEENGIEISAFCTDFISLVDETKREDYLEALKRTIDTAKSLGCKMIISQTGAEMSCPRNIQHANLVEGLKSCVPLLEDNGMTLVIEPLNIRVDHKGYYLSSSDEAAEIIKEVGSDHVKMLYDIYHQQITEGDLIRRIKEYLPYIGHFHSAGNPGRHELYYSEIDYKAIMDAIKETDYDGYIGLEYFPLDEPEKGLSYAKRVVECKG